MGFQSIDAVTSRLMNEMIAVYDDTRLNREMLRDKILVGRANVLSKYLRQHLGTIPGQYYNECCFDVVCESICEGSPTKVFRGKIPALLAQVGKKAIKYLGTEDGKTPFEWRDSAIEVGEDYSVIGCKKKDPFFILTGRKATVYNRPTNDMTKFYIKGIFSDPFACGCPDEDIFVPEDHIDEIEQQIKIDLSTFLYQRRIDKMNNANTDS